MDLWFLQLQSVQEGQIVFFDSHIALTERIMPNRFFLLAVFFVYSMSAQADANDVARINREVAAYKQGKAIDGAISEGRIIPGMTEEQVVQAKGYPTRRNDNGGNIQRVYPNRTGGTDYVYLRNGKTY